VKAPGKLEMRGTQTLKNYRDERKAIEMRGTRTLKKADSS
jgi:hypothetical protein